MSFAREQGATRDTSVRTLLDSREKWGVGLSLAGVAATTAFLAAHGHNSWVKISPALVGAFGSYYVFVVNAYIKQADDLDQNGIDPPAREAILKKPLSRYWPRIRRLGRLHIFAPLLFGALGSAALWFGNILR